MRTAIRRMSTLASEQLTYDLHSESLVQVHVADISTADGRVRQADLSVEIGAFEVHLATIVVNDRAGLIPSCQLSSRPEHTYPSHPGHHARRHRKSMGT